MDHPLSLIREAFADAFDHCEIDPPFELISDGAMQTIWMESNFESNCLVVRSKIAFGVRWDADHYLRSFGEEPDYSHRYSVIREDLSPVDNGADDRFLDLRPAVGRAICRFEDTCGPLHREAEAAALNEAYAAHPW